MSAPTVRVGPRDARLRAAEFLNRIDSIVIFQRLERERIRSIIDIQIERLAPVLKERRLQIVLTDEAKDLLVDLSYDPAFGARPLKRVLRERVLEPLSEELIAARIRSGDVVRVDVGPTKRELILRRVNGVAPSKPTSHVQA